MQLLIAAFGTDHYYQADGSFTATPAPWLASAAAAGTEASAPAAAVAAVAAVRDRPACVFSARNNASYIGNCAPLPPPKGDDHTPTIPQSTFYNNHVRVRTKLGCARMRNLSHESHWVQQSSQIAVSICELRCTSHTRFPYGNCMFQSCNPKLQRSQSVSEMSSGEASAFATNPILC